MVDAVGDDVGIALGTRVMAVTSFADGRGGFAESTIAPATTCFRVPDAMSDVDAASFRIGFSTAWIGLVRRGGLQPGESLLVLGAAGGSGAAAMQLGRALGARVIAVAAGVDKLRFCEELGADVLIDRNTRSIREAVIEATDGRGADVVYDPVGGELAASAARALASGGRLLAVGFASGAWVTVTTPDLVRRNASIVGVYAGGLTGRGERHGSRSTPRTGVRGIDRWLRAGRSVRSAPCRTRRGRRRRGHRKIGCRRTRLLIVHSDARRRIASRCIVHRRRTGPPGAPSGAVHGGPRRRAGAAHAAYLHGELCRVWSGRSRGCIARPS